MADRSFVRLVLVTLGATYLLILLGGVVSVADAGMGCGPHWPLCDGRWLPVHDMDMLLEWSHRLLAAVVGLLVLTVWVQALRTQRHQTVVLITASAALVLVVIQSLLGAITVRHHLPPAVSTVHLTTAMLFFLTMLVMAYWVHPVRGRIQQAGHASAPPSTFVLPLAGGMAALFTFATIVLGAYMRHTGAGLACPDWPLCHGQLLPLGMSLDVWAHLGHRFAALLTVAAVMLFFLLAAQSAQRHPYSRLLSRGALLLVLVQVLLGGATVIFELALLPATVHLGVGTLLLGGLALVPLVYLDETTGTAPRAREVAP